MLWHFTSHNNKHNVTINIQPQLLNCFYLQNRENAREGKESELKKSRFNGRRLLAGILSFCLVFGMMAGSFVLGMAVTVCTIYGNSFIYETWNLPNNRRNINPMGQIPLVSMRIKFGIYPHSMHKLAPMGALLICYLNSICIFTQP